MLSYLTATHLTSFYLKLPYPKLFTHILKGLYLLSNLLFLAVYSFSIPYNSQQLPQTLNSLFFWAVCFSFFSHLLSDVYPLSSLFAFLLYVILYKVYISYFPKNVTYLSSLFFLFFPLTLFQRLILPKQLIFPYISFLFLPSHLLTGLFSPKFW